MRKKLRLLGGLSSAAVLALAGGVLAQEGGEVTAYYHSGSGVENDAYIQMFQLFNEAQDQYVAVPTEIPGGDYNNQVVATALAGNLPCVLEIDGPNIANYVYADYLQPLDGLISEETLSDILPVNVEQGTIDGSLYALGQFEGGLAMWGNRALLEEAGVRIPEGIEDAWDLEELNSVLESLSQLGGEVYPIDLKMNYGAGEWFTFGFSPIVQSFGGDLIDRETYTTAEGVLNGPESVAAMEWFQSLFENGYTTATPPDDNDFINGRAAISFVGHWEYTRYLEALGDDLVLLPMPDFGNGAVTGTGSWAWGISANCDNVEGAAALIEFLLQPEQIELVTTANGAIPSRVSVLESSERFAEGGPLNIYAAQLANGVGVPRPLTPGYPIITQAFASAADAIARGEDVQTALDDAVDTIDADIEANDNYGFES